MTLLYHTHDFVITDDLVHTGEAVSHLQNEQGNGKFNTYNAEDCTVVASVVGALAARDCLEACGAFRGHLNDPDAQYELIQRYRDIGVDGLEWTNVFVAELRTHDDEATNEGPRIWRLGISGDNLLSVERLAGFGVFGSGDSVYNTLLSIDALVKLAKQNEEQEWWKSVVETALSMLLATIVSWSVYGNSCTLPCFHYLDLKQRCASYQDGSIETVDVYTAVKLILLHHLLLNNVDLSETLTEYLMDGELSYQIDYTTIELLGMCR